MRRRAVIGVIPVVVASATVLAADGCTSSSGSSGSASPRAFLFFTAHQAAVVEAATPLLEHPPAVERYAPGSWGPDSVNQLIAPRRWHLPDDRR